MTAPIAPPRWFAPALLAAPLLLMSMLSLDVVDDAYITARYARNLATGRGLVFNPGEYVEGVTNLLWTLVLAGVARLGFALDQAALLLGVGTGLGAMWMGGRIARELGASVRATAFAMLLLGLNHHYWLIVGNGLEAGLFSLLVACTVESALQSRRPALIGVLAGLTFLTRPESATIAGLIALYVGTRNMRRLERPRDLALREMAEMVLVFASIFASATQFRFAYFHALVPNSVTAKSVPLHLLLPNLSKGLRYLAAFARDTFPLGLGAAIALAVTRRRELVLLLLVIASEVPAVLINGGDWVGHSRLLIVYAPLMVGLCALGVDWLYSRVQGRTTALAALIVMVAYVPLALARNRDWSHGSQLPGILQCYRGVGERLIPVLHHGDVIASEAIGLIGYELPEIYVHDPMGLTDAYVAHHGTYLPRIGRVDYAYTYRTMHPGVLLLHQDDMFLPDFAAASGGRFETEYHAYYVDQGAPCSYYEKEGRDIQLVIAIRNDLLQRVQPALQGLSLRPVLIRPARRAR